jgi:hypothetical protein
VLRLVKATSSRASIHTVLRPWACAILAIVTLACSEQQEVEGTTQPSAPVAASASEVPAELAAGELDAPPADIKSTEKVRCLVDSPPGCDGCDKGDACVYEALSRYDCVYVVYGTDCSK